MSSPPLIHLAHDGWGGATAPQSDGSKGFTSGSVGVACSGVAGRRASRAV